MNFIKHVFKGKIGFETVEYIKKLSEKTLDIGVSVGYGGGLKKSSS